MVLYRCVGCLTHLKVLTHNKTKIKNLESLISMVLSYVGCLICKNLHWQWYPSVIIDNKLIEKIKYGFFVRVKATNKKQIWIRSVKDSLTQDRIRIVGIIDRIHAEFISDGHFFDFQKRRHVFSFQLQRTVKNFALNFHGCFANFGGRFDDERNYCAQTHTTQHSRKPLNVWRLDDFEVIYTFTEGK